MSCALQISLDEIWARSSTINLLLYWERDVGLLFPNKWARYAPSNRSSFSARLRPPILYKHVDWYKISLNSLALSPPAVLLHTTLQRFYSQITNQLLPISSVRQSAFHNYYYLLLGKGLSRVHNPANYRAIFFPSETLFLVFFQSFVTFLLFLLCK